MGDTTFADFVAELGLTKRQAMAWMADDQVWDVLPEMYHSRLSTRDAINKMNESMEKLKESLAVLRVRPG